MQSSSYAKEVQIHRQLGWDLGKKGKSATPDNVKNLSVD